jgi:hypothetical protein
VSSNGNNDNPDVHRDAMSKRQELSTLQITAQFSRRNVVRRSPFAVTDY